MNKKKLRQQELLQKPVIVWIGALICCALWGSAFPMIKLGYSFLQIPQSDTATQILFAGYRFTISGILTIAGASIFSRKLLLPQKSSAGKIMWLCLLQTVVQYIFFYIGLANASGVKSSIMEATNVFFSILIAALLFRQEKLDAKKIIGCLVGFAGVVFVNLQGGRLDTNMSFFGEGFIVLSALSYGFSSVYLKIFSKKENPVMLSGYQFLAGGIILSAIGLGFGGHLTDFNIKGILVLLYLAFVSAMAYGLWGMLLKYNTMSKVAVFGFMNPVFGVILSALLLKESAQAFGIKSLVALIFVCTGIYIVNRTKPFFLKKNPEKSLEKEATQGQES